MASPELYPGAGIALTPIELYILKRLSDSAPYTFVRFTNWLNGAISPFAIRTKVLSSEGIKVNVTLIFTANQALLAARAGAAYVSPFLGRLDDISVAGINLVKDIVQIFKAGDIHTEIIAASIRNPIHVTDGAMAGADIATVPYSVLEAMTKHPLTDAGIEKFVKDYQAVFHD